MLKFLTMLLACIALAAPAWPQESETAADAPAVAEEGAAEADVAEATELPEAAVEIDLDDDLNADLDEQGYEEDEDEFVPTEEIPADEPIPFPSNI